jgi:hypothetical protein
MTDVTSYEVIRLGVWIALTAVITVISTVVVTLWGEHDQVAPSDDATARHWLAAWAIVSGGSLLAAAVLGGLVVFTSRAPWDAVLTIPFAAGPVVGAAAFITLVAMGQTEPGSASCGIDEGDCNIALAMGAGLLSLVAAISLGASFILTHLMRRALMRLLVPRRG